jgi:hypothetical protein
VGEKSPGSAANKPTSKVSAFRPGARNSMPHNAAPAKISAWNAADAEIARRHGRATSFGERFAVTDKDR